MQHWMRFLKCKSKLQMFIMLLIMCGSCLSQTVITPLPLESEKLAKLKAQSGMLTERLETISAQITALKLSLEITKQQQAQKQSEFLGYAGNLKKSHTEWGKDPEIEFFPDRGEGGEFVFTRQANLNPPVLKLPDCKEKPELCRTVNKDNN